MIFKPTELAAFPADAVTQTMAFLGKRGSGKTYAAGRMVESFLDGGVQVVVLDPVGNWWGLRLARDGKKQSKFTIPILGGERGDVPLEATGGAVVAKFVVDTGSSCVLDVSGFSKADMKRFVRAFADELYRLKKRKRSPIHVVLEEAQLFAPQRVSGDTAALLGAIEYLVRLGRNYGIGVSMLSQRPQSVNKELLNQTELLVVFQLVGAHERRAVLDWTREMSADKADLEALPGLGVGDCFIWSPSWLRIFKRTRFLQKRSYDASGTPTMDEQVGGDLKPVQLDALEEAMRTTIERAKQVDPKHLRRRISELEKELAAAPAAGPGQEEIAAAVREAVQAREVEFATWHEEILRKINGTQETVIASVDQLAAALHGQVAELGAAVIAGPKLDTISLAKIIVPTTGKKVRIMRNAPAPAGNGSEDLGGGQKRMVEVLLQVAPAGLSESQWATLSKLKKTGGTWSKYRGLVVKGGHVEKRDGLWYACGVDSNVSGLSPAERRALWTGAFGGGTARMIDALLHNGGEMSREALGVAVDIEVTGGTFGKYLGFLTRNRLAVVEDGIVIATEELGA